MAASTPLRLTWISALVVTLAALGTNARAAEIRAGAAKENITPDEPLRLSGYASRTTPHEGVDTPLWVRALAIDAGEQPTCVLLSVDTIGLPGSLVTDVANALRERHGLQRSQIAVACTHSHVAPHIAGALTNLFHEPLSDEERAATERYTKRVQQAMVEAASEAVESLRPASIAHATGSADFAINRRVLRDGTWSGFGETNGPVDHTVDCLRITGAEGEIIAVAFNYACHCTTLGGDHNRVGGDWAGYAAARLESAGDLVALCTIGCGADANPNPRGTLEMAQQHGEQLALEVRRILSQPMQPVGAVTQTTFGYAGLPSELPTREELQAEVNSDDVSRRRNAQRMLEVIDRKGRLPATYPMPIQTWQFGDALTMVFLGGEVVVDYALRLKREIEQGAVWVTAYANDVFAYVASERMRDEGGYEVDRSMDYYAQPGRWASGTEDLIIREVHGQLERGSAKGDLSAEEARECFKLQDGWQVELVASEPQIADPVSLAFAPDGRVWVAEMGDYPGVEEDGRGTGRVKILEDRDSDGRYEHATVFLEGLSFPTGVYPWEKGAIISAAPDIFYAEDTDGDGAADHRQALVRGFAEANPQHRVNGFSAGLDGWLYFSGGDDLDSIAVSATAQTLHASGHDLALDPRTGQVRLESGATQFGRYRNDWGEWFGGNNSRPIWHYAIPQRYLGNTSGLNVRSKIELLTPNVAPPVFSATDVAARFNDLFAAGRFTSACSPAPVRDDRLRRELLDADAEPNDPRVDVALICEPVHNLVHRAILEPDGAGLAGRRHRADHEREWLSSTDQWFRPVQALPAPDGSVWIVDMYRQTIEHPQWIPDDWQAQLDLRAGETRGRIWRVFPADRSAEPATASHTIASTAVTALGHPSGLVRDWATASLASSVTAETVHELRAVIAQSPSAAARLHALSALQQSGRLDADSVTRSLADGHSGIVCHALRLSELLQPHDRQLKDAVLRAAEHPDPAVRQQAALTIGLWSGEDAARVLARIALRDAQDPLIIDSVLCNASPRIWLLLDALQECTAEKKRQWSSAGGQHLLRGLLSLAARADGPRLNRWVSDRLRDADSSGWQMELIDAWTRVAASRDELLKSFDGAEQLVHRIDEIANAPADPNQSVEKQITKVQLIAAGIQNQVGLVPQLLQFLTPEHPERVQVEAALALVQRRDEESQQMVLDRLPTWEPRVQTVALDAMMQRHEGMLRLLDAMETGKLSPQLLDSSFRQRLLQQGNKTIRVRAERLLDVGPTQERRAVLDEYGSRARKGGDAEEGRKAFERSCASCHRVGELGHAVGPDLASLGNRSTEALLIATLDPNSAVEARFRPLTILTRDGRLLTGVVTEQSVGSITLIRPNGLVDVVDRSEIEQLRSGERSLMPDNLEKDLTPQDVANVIAYIQSL